MGLGIGSTRLTADGVVGVSGSPTRIYSIIVKSGGTAAQVTIHNGTTGGADEFMQIDGTVNAAVITNFAGGLFLPAGGFCNVDANTTYATILYTTE